MYDENKNEIVETDDNRSYHISSEKISSELGFVTKRSVSAAVHSLVENFRKGNIPESFEDNRYFNVRYLQDNLIDENCT